MARQPRIALAGRCHLVSQCSLREHGAFIDDEDRRFYLAVMFESSRAAGVAVHAYALANRQVQILATPETDDALGHFMQRLGRRYVHRFNRRHGNLGSLWHGRFGATALLSERFLLQALLTVEQLPVREALCAAASEWVWSSAGHHLGLRLDARLVDPAIYWAMGNTPFERQVGYLKLLRVLIGNQGSMALEVAARSGWPSGDKQDIELYGTTKDGRLLMPRARGRPRKSE